MSNGTQVSFKMKVFPKGQVVIPVSLRKKYHIENGDRVAVIPNANGILIKPMLPKKGKKSLTDSLFGIFGKYAKGKPKLEKADISEATEAGFIEGRKK